ncbi:MAG: type IV toxin-antitoxin system AbiEi family antitoxin [Pelolinea sp.]|nr:type IV toxin-antitoxin system AbiEi family antitoxin [Pelolinea sp.]
MENSDRAINIIREIFQNIPFIDIKECKKEYGLSEKFIADILIIYVYKNKTREIIIEAKSKGEPRFVRDSVNQLLRFKEIRPNAYFMIAAPFISQNSADICINSNFGYLDYAGNILINNDPIFIQKNVVRNPIPEKRELRRLYSPKSERILRVMLNTGKKKWLTEELAEEAKVSLGLVAKVKNILLNKEWLESEYGGFSLIKPFDLLNEWSDNYLYKKNRKIYFYSMSPVREMEFKLGKYFNENNIPYAFTGQSAGARYAPMVRYKTIKVYINSVDIKNDLENKLGIKQVESGANIQFLIPYDEGLMYGVNQFDGIFVVSQIQAYLDLISDKARGEEAAIEIINNGVMKIW